ncbi:MAG: TetR/AcrR family transcriptional regulator [Planctomycetota bacterium]
MTTARAQQRRLELLPTLAESFAELGYRRSTTAELARRCELRENQLYRLWPSKKAMFIAAIGWLFDAAVARWGEIADAGGPGTAAERILAYESRHRGRSGLYRIIFAALSETEDDEIRRSLRDLYRRLHAFIRDRVAEHRGGSSDPAASARIAWAVIGLATIGDITRELRLAAEPQRRSMMTATGARLLEGD